MQELSSLGADAEGTVFNINADTIASEIAIQLKAEKLVLLSDVDGLYTADPTRNVDAVRVARVTRIDSKVMAMVFFGSVTPMPK